MKASPRDSCSSCASARTCQIQPLNTTSARSSAGCDLIICGSVSYFKRIDAHPMGNSEMLSLAAVISNVVSWVQANRGRPFSKQGRKKQVRSQYETVAANEALALEQCSCPFRTKGNIAFEYTTCPFRFWSASSAVLGGTPAQMKRAPMLRAPYVSLTGAELEVKMDFQTALSAPAGRCSAALNFFRFAAASSACCRVGTTIQLASSLGVCQNSMQRHGISKIPSG